MTQISKKALIIDDERLALEFYSEVLSSRQFEVIKYSCPKKLLTDMKNGLHSLDIVLVDYNLPEIKGNDLLKSIQEYTQAPILIFTSESDLSQAVEVIRLGAFDYIEKNFSDTNKLLVSIEKAMQHGNLKVENTQLKKKIELNNNDFTFLKSQNPYMNKVIYTAEKVASTNVPALILGEKGSGKDSLAKYIFKLSNHSNQSFTQINCAAIPHSLMKKEILGDQTTPSLLSRNAGNTIYLDEISYLPIEIQHHFVNEYEKLGENPNLRLIASSSKEISNLVREGLFLEKLFYKLSIVTLSIPPLRHRKEDILDQANYFLSLANKKYQKDIKGFTESAIYNLLNSKLNGNTRDLQHIIERSVILCENEKIDDKIIVPTVNNEVSSNHIFHSKFQANLNLKEIEKEYTKFVINFHQGDLVKAAKTLDVSKRTIYRKIQSNESNYINHM